jgi:TRAP-type C4-dicarboxylate transport system permease small subunit
MLSIINRILGKAVYWSIALVHGAIVVILFTGVVTRYVFNAPLFWGEEVTILCLIWLTFLGGAVLVRQDKNVTITIFTDMLPARVVHKIGYVNHVLVITCLVVMIGQSWKLSEKLSDSTTPALRLSEWWFAVALLAGFIIMLFYQIQHFVALFRNRKAFPEDTGHEERCEL